MRRLIPSKVRVPLPGLSRLTSGLSDRVGPSMVRGARRSQQPDGSVVRDDPVVRRASSMQRRVGHLLAAGPPSVNLWAPPGSAACDGRVAITLTTPTVDELGHVVRTLRDWQDDASPMQLHPGDLGWYSRFGVDALAGAVRTWRRSGRLLAIGLLDGANVLRATVALEAWRDEELAHQVVSDVSDPERGVLPTGKASVEAPNGTRVQDLLSDVGWSTDESWTPLRRDLTKPVEPSGLRVEVIGLGEESEFTAVHRSAWGKRAVHRRALACDGGRVAGPPRRAMPHRA